MAGNCNCETSCAYVSSATEAVSLFDLLVVALVAHLARAVPAPKTTATANRAPIRLTLRRYVRFPYVADGSDLVVNSSVLAVDLAVIASALVKVRLVNALKGLPTCPLMPGCHDCTRHVLRIVIYSLYSIDVNLCIEKYNASTCRVLITFLPSFYQVSVDTLRHHHCGD